MGRKLVRVLPRLRVFSLILLKIILELNVLNVLLCHGCFSFFDSQQKSTWYSQWPFDIPIPQAQAQGKTWTDTGTNYTNTSLICMNSGSESCVVSIFDTRRICENWRKLILVALPKTKNACSYIFFFKDDFVAIASTSSGVLIMHELTAFKWRLFLLLTEHLFVDRIIFVTGHFPWTCCLLSVTSRLIKKLSNIWLGVLGKSTFV